MSTEIISVLGTSLNSCSRWRISIRTLVSGALSCSSRASRSRSGKGGHQGGQQPDLLNGMPGVGRIRGSLWMRGRCGRLGTGAGRMRGRRRLRMTSRRLGSGEQQNGLRATLKMLLLREGGRCTLMQTTEYWLFGGRKSNIPASSHVYGALRIHYCI